VVGSSLAEVKKLLGQYDIEFWFCSEYCVSSANSKVNYLFDGEDWEAVDDDTCVKVAGRLGDIVNGFTGTETIDEFTARLSSATRVEMLESGGTS